MKKALLIILLITGAVSAQSQIKKITQLQLAPSRAKVALPQQQTDLRKPVGKDLKTALVCIDKNSSNFAIGEAGIYTINFDIINSVGEDINIIGTGVQSYLRTVSGYNSPAGGFTLMPPAPHLPANGILHPEDKFHGSYLVTGFNPSSNSNNKFIIIFNDGNTLEIPVTGNLESWSTPFPDLTVQKDAIAPVTGSIYLNTLINVSVENSGAGKIPLDVVRQIIPQVQVYPFATRVINIQTYQWCKYYSSFYNRHSQQFTTA